MNQPLDKVMEKMRVLIVDDDPNVADALKLIMEDAGYEAIIAVNARECMELAVARQFDLTITDLQLPDMSGLDILVFLRNKSPRVPVIIITSHTSPEIRGEAMIRGAFQVLSKPFLPSEILELARRAITDDPLTSGETSH